MTISTKYYTLIGSLPALPRHFEEAERVPISKLRLMEVLRMLEPDDAKVIKEVANFLAWERQPLERTDGDMIARFDRFMTTVDNRFAQDLIRYSLSVRSIIAALRCRRLGLDPPGGIEPVASRIARGWSHPDFRLGNQYSWIGEVDAKLNSGAPLDVERELLNVTWRRAGRLADRFHFVFETVVLYLIRWGIVYRWTQRDAAAGQQKFEQLVSDAMGEYTEIFAD